MIYIDNRLLVPVSAPFVVLLMLRLFWAFAGLEWSPEPFALSFAFFVSFMIGCVVCAAMYDARVKIGGFWIGRKTGGDA